MENVMSNFDAYWEAWAPVWTELENFFFEIDSLNQIMSKLEPPVLIVGAGLGLLVENLKNRGIECDGIDLSAQMVARAKDLRGLDLIHGDASAMPIEDNSYNSCISASGVIDFIGDEELIKKIIAEIKRVTVDSGNIFIAFGHFSPEMESVCREMGVLEGNHLKIQDSLKHAAFMATMDLSEIEQQPSIGTEKEQKFGMGYYKIFSEAEDPNALIEVAPEFQYYRTEPEVREMFKNIDVELKELEVTETSYIAQI
jgi:hypothetical protein